MSSKLVFKPLYCFLRDGKRSYLLLAKLFSPWVLESDSKSDMKCVEITSLSDSVHTDISQFSHGQELEACAALMLS